MRRVSVFLTAAAFFLALANFSPGASRDLPTLFPIKQVDRWGFVDQTGKLVIPPRFLNAGNFSEELAAVEVCSGWGYIDRSGKFVWQTTDACDRWGKPLEK
jgi:hypothetical protein